MDTFEKDVLAALRDPAFWSRWGGTLPQGVLSPLGQRVARALAWCHKAQKQGKRVVVGAANLEAALKRDKAWNSPMREFLRPILGAGKIHPEVQQALAEETLRRASLDALVRQAIAQQQSGRVDLDALGRALRAFQDKDSPLADFDPGRIGAYNHGALTLPTPWQAVNEEVGGLRVRELGMVMATPKVGKTKMLLNLVVGALESDWNVLYITAADVGYGDLCLRLAATWLEEPFAEVAKDPGAWEVCRKQWGERGVTVTVADYSARPCGLLDIERDVETMRGRLGADARLALFIDRLEDAIPAERTGEVRRDITGNYQAARMLASRYAVPCWVDSQAALREGDEGWVDITRGAESRIGKAKVVDLSFGVGVHPDDREILRLQIAGRRAIRQHRFELRTDPRSGSVYE